jgi:dihydrofolate reductase
MSIRPSLVRIHGERPALRGLSGSRRDQVSRIVVVNHVTLDGVMQAPGRPDEDARDGFQRGGWAVPYFDAVMGRAMGRGMAQGGALLFGRRTYVDFFSVWPDRTDNPFTEVLNNAQKYVASRTLKEPLPWRNSTLLEGDAMDAVADMKSRGDADLVVLGSGELIQSLMRHNLIDEFVLTIHPLVLGAGRRLFPDGGAPTTLQLVETETTTTGVVIAKYRPVDPAGAQTSRHVAEPAPRRNAR